MDTEAKPAAPHQPPRIFSEISEWWQHFPPEFRRCWQLLPNKDVFFPMLIAWLLLFQFLGNATFGYIDTASLFWWMKVVYWNPLNSAEDGHGLLIPPLVLALLWWKRKKLLAVQFRLWWPAMLLLAAALALHLFGYLLQQPRISIVALFTGIYALTGLAWGPGWMRASFFPFFLFIFCVPVTSIGEPVTVPLRELVTRIVAFVCHHLFRMDVHDEGNLLFNSARTYQYEVAAACSGLRSFIAVLVLAIVYAFVCFDKTWKRSLIILSGVPLAIIGNVIRLMCIVISASIWGQRTGNFVHENFLFSLIPYVPALLGVIWLGGWLGEKRHAPPSTPTAPQPV